MLYDLVYPLKNPTETPKLKYSLRSVCKYAKFRNVYFVGYKFGYTRVITKV